MFARKGLRTGSKQGATSLAQSWVGCLSSRFLAKGYSPCSFMLVWGALAVREQCVVSSGHGLSAETCLDAIAAGDPTEDRCRQPGMACELGWWQAHWVRNVWQQHSPVGSDEAASLGARNFFQVAVWQVCPRESHPVLSESKNFRCPPSEDFQGGTCVILIATASKASQTTFCLIALDWEDSKAWEVEVWRRLLTQAAPFGKRRALPMSLVTKGDKPSIRHGREADPELSALYMIYPLVS